MSLDVCIQEMTRVASIALGVGATSTVVLYARYRDRKTLSVLLPLGLVALVFILVAKLF